MENVTRRQLFKATATVGLGATVGTIVPTSFAHETAAPPSSEETLEFLSSAMSVRVLVGLLYGAWEISLMVVASNESIDLDNPEEFMAYRNRNEYRSSYENALGVIYALDENEQRQIVRQHLSERLDLVDLASQRFSRVYGAIVDLAADVRGVANNQRAMDTVASLHHHERILTIVEQSEESNDQPILCRFFPFSRICDWLD